MRRREFLASLAAAGATARMGVAPARRLARVGLELYTVRAEMRRDPEATLAEVARIGYKDVELLWSMGNFGRSTAQVRAALDANGLRAPSAHIDPSTILTGWDQS